MPCIEVDVPEGGGTEKKVESKSRLMKLGAAIAIIAAIAFAASRR